MIHALLVWAAIVGIVLAFIVVPASLRNPREKPWRRAAYFILGGPPVWIVLIVVLLVAAIGFAGYSWKRSRAKKTTA